MVQWTVRSSTGYQPHVYVLACNRAGRPVTVSMIGGIVGQRGGMPQRIGGS